MHVREWKAARRQWRELRVLVEGLLLVPPVLLFTPNGKRLVVVHQTRVASLLDPVDFGQLEATGQHGPQDFDG